MDYGWLSLLPPMVAVVMAIRSRNVILSLFCGGFVGTMIFCMGNPFLAVKSMIGDYFFVQLTDSYNAGVIVLVIFIGGFIKLMEKSGGAQAFSRFVYRFVNTKLKAQMCAWAGGILIFFSDLGTPLLVGPVFRPLFDKLKISREKLAWILDSTSSPVAILVPFIGWGVYIMGLIQAEFQNLGVTQSDYTTFVEAIPFQIYAILAIIMIPLVAFTGKDFSQRGKAEKLAEKGAQSWEEEKEAEEETDGTYSVKNARPSMAHAFGISYAIAVGAVLSGGLFGDHCSPISDTTILSSTGAQCDLVGHVKTQLPYAVVNGVIAFAAYLFAGLTGSPAAVALAVAALVLVIFVWNKKEKDRA